MRLACLYLIVAGVLFSASPAAAQQASGARPASGVLELMKAVIIPASDSVFSVGKGAPKNDKEWSAVQDGAAKLNAAGQQLTQQAPSANGANWIKYSKAMSDAADTAGKAAKAKNADAVLDAGDALYSTCEDCHKQYMKK